MQRVNVKRPPDMPNLTKSVEAAGTDMKDMVIQTQSRRNINADQTNMTAGNGNVRP